MSSLPLPRAPVATATTARRHQTTSHTRGQGGAPQGSSRVAASRPQLVWSEQSPGKCELVTRVTSHPLRSLLGPQEVRLLPGGTDSLWGTDEGANRGPPLTYKSVCLSWFMGPSFESWRDPLGLREAAQP